VLLVLGFGVLAFSVLHGAPGGTTSGSEVSCSGNGPAWSCDHDPPDAARETSSTTRLEFDETDPEGFSRRPWARVGKTAGGEELAVKAFRAAAGPEPLPVPLRVRRGSGCSCSTAMSFVRTPEDEQELVRGEPGLLPGRTFGCPQGEQQQRADRAHTHVSRGAREPSVAVYPDSDKIGVWPGVTTTTS